MAPLHPQAKQGSRGSPMWNSLRALFRMRDLPRLATAMLLTGLGSLSVTGPDPALAHPGGLNAQGCHSNRKTGDYHCHRAAAPIPTRREPVERAPLMGTAVYYRSCAEARAAGVAPLRTGDVGYRPGLDGDGDGIACEAVTGSAVTPPVRLTTTGELSATSSGASLPLEPVVGKAVATDGDTLAIGGSRIRLYGVDAFEAEQRCTGANGQTWGCGGVATRALQDLVSEGQTICWPKERDAYGRIVAVCRNGGVDLSAALVVRGLAVAYSKYSSDYEAEQALAKGMLAGAWGAPFTQPEEYRRSGGDRSAAIAAREASEAGECVIKGNVSSRGRKLFFRPGDNNYDRVKAETVFCGEAEALAAGFTHAGS